MSTYSIKEAQDRLPDLIDRALEGEGVVIRRESGALVELRPVQRAGSRPINKSDIEWVRQRRVKGLPGAESVGATLDKLRGE